jgi:hypothetical protein
MNLTAIMQPTFFPWIGYFDLIDQVESFVFFDDVQLVKRSWQVRNRIKSANGELFLTVPVKKNKNRDELLISETEISYDENWQSKHLKSIESAYKKAYYFDSIFSFLQAHYQRKHETIALFNEDFITGVAINIGIKTTFVSSSSLQGIEGVKDGRLAAICKKLAADEYLSPQGSAIYIEAETAGGKLTEEGIALYYHVFQHPVYRQLYGQFVPYMGIVDLLFNEGFDNALAIIRSGRQKKMYFEEYREQFLKSQEGC